MNGKYIQKRGMIVRINLAVQKSIYVITIHHEQRLCKVHSSTIRFGLLVMEHIFKKANWDQKNDLPGRWAEMKDYFTKAYFDAGE